MATKATTKKTTKAAPPKAHLLEKDITPTMDRFCDWIRDETGYDVDPMSVQLGGTLRGEFQKSDVNQAALAESKQRRAEEAEARAAKREEREAKKAEKENKKSAPAKPAGKAAATKAAPAAKGKGKVEAKPTATRRRPAGKKGEDF